MKTLFLLPGLRRGGAERRLVDLAAGLRARGHDVAVATLMMPRDDEAHVLDALREEARIEPADLGYGGVRDWRVWPRTARALVRLRRLLAAARPDVLHAMLPSANIVAAAAVASLPRRARPALVAGREGLPTYGRERPWLVWAEDAAARRADSTLCVCDAIRRAILASPRARWYRRLDVVPNGIDPAPWATLEPQRRAARAALAAELGLPAVPRRLAVVVANLHPYKGHADLLEAAALCRAADPDFASEWLVACVGADLKGHRVELERRARELGVAGNVRFLGPRPDVRPVVRAADLLVSPSHEEGLSLALAEGMAAGLALLATDVGGTPELVDAEVGVLVPPRDPAALAGQLGRLLRSPDGELRAMGARGAARVAARFTLDAMIDGTLAVYRALRPDR